MKHRIDPTVDCVFKALLGSEANKNLLIHFLNAVLAPVPTRRIVNVTLLNPFNERDFFDDKLTVVDVKAQDAAGLIFQIEVQLLVYEGLLERVVYTWADCFSKQLKRGMDYVALKPVIAIWIISGILLKDEGLSSPGETAALASPEPSRSPPRVSPNVYHHHFQWCDLAQQVRLGELGSIHLLELGRWHKDRVDGELDRWTRFFHEGRLLDDLALPDYMETPEMKQAMETLKEFSERERRYDVYRRRRDFLLEQATIRNHLTRAEQKLQTLTHQLQTSEEEKLAARAREQAALQEKQAAYTREQAALAREQALREEKEQLMRLLAESRGATGKKETPSGD